MVFVHFCLCYGGLGTIVVSKWGRGYFASSFAAMQLYFICFLWLLLIHGDIRIRFLAVFLALQDSEIIAMVIVISGLVF